MRGAWCRYTLDFRFTAVTSRERLTRKQTYYIKLWSNDDPSGPFGLGEAALFRGLSSDDRPGYEETLAEACLNPGMDLSDWPSIRMAIETAQADLANGGRRIIYPSDWTLGTASVPINGLVWMGDRSTMEQRMRQKLADGFRCIKIKIGGIDFEDELRLLRLVRTIAPDDVELRLDANGAFAPGDALRRLDALAEYRIHSIEQPIRQGQWAEMARICRQSPIPVALDEELIGINDPIHKREMIDAIRPAYIILKPTLTGGFAASEEWIRIAEESGAGWWITSALESDIGLNAIAQWTATLHPHMSQGLGTGALYSNNIPSPLSLCGDRLSYDPGKRWQLPNLAWNYV